jgi:hypothetical protein
VENFLDEKSKFSGVSPKKHSTDTLTQLTKTRALMSMQDLFRREGKKENMLFIDASLKRTPNETSTLAIITREAFKLENSNKL